MNTGFSEPVVAEPAKDARANLGFVGRLLRPFPIIAATVARSPIACRFAHGTFWSVVGAVLSRLLALSGGIAVARVLGRHPFGELSVVQGTSAMFQAFAGLAMGITATKFVAEHRRADPARAGRLVALSNVTSVSAGALMTLAVFLAAPSLANHAFASPALTPELRISALALLFGAWNGAQIGTLSGFEAFRANAASSLLAGVCTVGALVGGAFADGLRGGVWGLVVGSLASCLVYHVALRRVLAQAGVAADYRGAPEEWRVLIHFSLPATLASLLVGPANWASSAIVARQPGGFAEVALFSAANQWRTAILFLPSALSTVVLPMLSSLRGAADRPRFTRVLRLGLTLSAGAALVAGLIVASASRLILRAYGPGFDSGALVLVLLSASAVAAAALNVVGYSLASSGRMWWGFHLNAVWALVLVSITWVLRDRGALALGWANLIAYSVHFCTVGIFVWFDHHTWKVT